MTETRPVGEPGPQEVAAFLRRHPDFLLDHPDLALVLRVPRQNGPATSLAGYQLEVLREHNAELKRRLQELTRLAQENERLSLRVHAFALALLRARSRAEILSRAVASLREDFGTEAVRLLLYEPESALAGAEWLLALPRTDSRLARFHEVIERREVLCGRLRQDRLELLFGEQASAIGSAALLPLPGSGLLGIGSGDPERFHPGIGTFFLERLGEILSAALARHAASP